MVVALCRAAELFLFIGDLIYHEGTLCKLYTSMIELILYVREVVGRRFAHIVTLCR